ncbi:MAG: stage III sporulation protein AA [Lachnospiraceae bacterium]
MKQDIFRIFSMNLRKRLQQLSLDMDQLQELRLRVNEPCILIYRNTEYILDRSGVLCKDADNPYIITTADLEETIGYISNYSLYAYEDEIRQGFLTIRGGHRVGLAGKVIVENGRIKNVQYITFMNVRISHEVKNCAEMIVPYISDGDDVYHTLLISPPRCGKTTVLRDLIRLLSNGVNGKRGMNVGVVDERSELAACYHGIPQNDMGMRTDILDCCPKDQGMMMLVRSMSPQVIAVDEIGSREDVMAMEYVMNCGCRLLATVHGSSVDEVKQKPVLRKLIEEKIFQRYVILDNQQHVGNVAQIFDAQGNLLYGRDGWNHFSVIG